MSARTMHRRDSAATPSRRCLLSRLGCTLCGSMLCGHLGGLTASESYLSTQPLAGTVVSEAPLRPGTVQPDVWSAGHLQQASTAWNMSEGGCTRPAARLSADSGLPVHLGAIQEHLVEDP